ncbi:TonB-dependent receptor plug domain-containing protein [Fulvivirga sp. 29W222]|uniref:TonB-dependent receptor plug domain-containing protein n=1 Tax=Fulvivirga marina TaxID=2494733 RepID=A0A937FXG7_9BACT|nr:TonB-dependent receptor [Fulvivirga marina]MBL6446211.1 TonB-dependent receptor plug domain-containing protein [Fulvivirga marina]
MISRIPKTLIFAALLLTHISTFSQEKKDCATDCSCIISGVIMDASTHEPVPYATVQIKNSEKGVLTDEAGKFLFNKLCEKEFDIFISHLGYKSVIHHHDIYHPDLVVKLAPSDVILESIVIEGSSIETGLESMTESKISGKDLESMQNESLGDVLSNITGVSTLKTGQNVVKPMIHGLHGSRVLIINNGVRHEGQGWGQEHAPEIDAAMADNIALVKGAASVKYGPDAMGGVIIINPPKMELSTGHLHGAAGITTATNGRSINTDLLLQQGYKNFAWMGQVAGLYQGDLSAPDHILTNTGARELSYMFGSRYHHKKLDLTILYSHVEQTLGILRGSVVGNLNDLDIALKAKEPFFTESFSYDINNPRQEVSHDLVRLKGHYNFKDHQLNFQYGFQANTRQEFDVRRGSNNERPAIDLELFTHTFDLDWQHAQISGWNGTVGTQWLYQDNNNIPGTNTIPFVPNYNNNRFGIYIIESKALGSLDFELGLRYDYQSSSIRGRDTENDIYKQDLNYQSITGLVGVNAQLGKNTSFRSNFGTAWRPPNIAELYSYGKHEFTIDFGLWRHSTDEFGTPISSTDVLDQNQKPVDNELGFKWVNTFNHTTKEQSLEVTAHFNYLKGYIYSKPAGIAATVRGPFPFYIYDQTDAVFFGLDASYIYRHSTIWESQIKGSYLHARDVNNDDFFIGIPPNRISYELSHSKSLLGLDEFSAAFETSYTFEQFNSPRVITVAEINDAQLNGENLFQQDRSNFDFLPAPSGYLLMNLKLQGIVNQFVFGVEFKNILNYSYRDYTNRLRYFADETGFNMLISARYKF